jgi:hypothetical protein
MKFLLQKIKERNEKKITQHSPMIDEITLAKVNCKFTIWCCFLKNFNCNDHFCYFFF